jgi:glycosyltransferase involved in cell wall biosynthesis
MSRIVYLSRATIPSYEANALQIMKMCAGMAALGHEVELVALTGEVRADPFAFFGVAETFNLHRLGPQEAGNGKAQLVHMARLLARLPKPDLVYARDRALAAMWPGNESITFEAHLLPQGMRRAVEHFLWHRPTLHRWIVISENLGAAYRSRFSRGHHRIVCAPTAVENAPSPDFVLSSLERKLPPRRQGALRFGFFGNAHPGKGAGWVAELARQIPQHDFIASVGMGQQQESLRSTAARSQNFFLLPPQTPAMAQPFCAAMDVLLAPYGTHVFSKGGNDITPWMSPMKISQYLSAGRPIIASDLPAFANVLTQNENALLVAPEDLGQWKSAIQKTEVSAHRKRLTQNARNAVMQRPDWTERAAHVLGHEKAP